MRARSLAWSVSVVLVVGLRQVEVGLGQAEERRFEPETAARVVEELGALAAALVAVDGVGEDVALVLIGRIAAAVPAGVLPVVVAGVVRRVVAAELDVGLGARLDLGDIGHPVGTGPGHRVPDLRPGDLGAVGRPVLLQMVRQDAAAVGVVAVVALVAGAVDEVHERIPAAGVVELVGEDQFRIGGNRGGLAVVVEGVRIGLAHAGAAGVQEGHAVRGGPAEDGLVGVDGRLPALLVHVAEADDVVMLAVVRKASRC